MKSPTSEIKYENMYDFPNVLSFYVTRTYQYIDANYGCEARRCKSPSTAHSQPVVQTDPLYRTVGEVAAQSGATSTEPIQHCRQRNKCAIGCRKGSQTQQCILTYISVELHVSAYIEAIIRFNIAT